MWCIGSASEFTRRVWEGSRVVCNQDGTERLSQDRRRRGCPSALWTDKEDVHAPESPFLIAAPMRVFSESVAMSASRSFFIMLLRSREPRVWSDEPFRNDHVKHPELRASRARLLAAAVILTVVAGENLTVGSTVWLPAESMAPGR